MHRFKDFITCESMAACDENSEELRVVVPSHEQCQKTAKVVAILAEAAARGDKNGVAAVLPDLFKRIAKIKEGKSSNYTFTCRGKSSIKMSFAAGEGQNQPCQECHQLLALARKPLKEFYEAHTWNETERKALEIGDHQAAKVEQRRQVRPSTARSCTGRTGTRGGACEAERAGPAKSAAAGRTGRGSAAELGTRREKQAAHTARSRHRSMSSNDIERTKEDLRVRGPQRRRRVTDECGTR